MAGTMNSCLKRIYNLVRIKGDMIREEGKIPSEGELYTLLVQEGRSIFLCLQVESHKATPKVNLLKKRKFKNFLNGMTSHRQLISIQI